MAFEALDGGRLRIASEFRSLLQANGLDSFARVMAAPEGELKRNFPGRRTSRLELRREDGAIQAVYLKRYYPEYLSPARRWLRRMGWPGSGDEAAAEWAAAVEIAALGIPTLSVVAWGRDTPASRAVRSSFVMTLELAGAEEGHRFTARLDAVDRRKMLRRVGEFTRMLHAGGLVHKDLYLCHFMASRSVGGTERQADGPAISLIDLQRVTRPCCFINRWRVKDLAALTYSSLKAGATGRDIAAAFRAYRDGRRLDDASRRLARQVARRVAWLKTRTPRHDSDFEQLR